METCKKFFQGERGIVMNLLDGQREAFHARVVVLNGDGSSSVLDLLRAENEVVVADDPVHQGMVTSVNDMENSDPEFWRYAVEGSKVLKPASETVAAEGERILWWYGDDPDPPSLT